MIDSGDSLDLSSEHSGTSATNALSATTTTSIANDFSDEAESSVGGNNGQVPSSRAQHSAVGTDASSSNSETHYPPDVKAGFDELCPVCGDKVSGYHYGLLTCESCKGFFKRTVQNKKVYSCVDNRSCHIDKSQRKRCPYCRFQKCLNVGMKLEAVRQDRMRGGRNKFGPMYKRDRALKQQQLRQQQHMLAECEMNISGGAPASPIDIKPDPALLQASISMPYNSTAVAPGVGPSAADISSVAAAVAAAVAVASVGNGSQTAATGNGYSSLSHGTSAGGRGSQGASSNGSSPLHAENTRAAISHTLHHSHHQHHTSNSLHQSSNHNGNSHLHHQQQLTEAPYILQQPHHPPSSTNPNFIGQSLSLNGSSTNTLIGNVMDNLQGYGIPPPSVPASVPQLMRELKANLMEEEDVKQKMLNFLRDSLRQLDTVIHPEQLLPIICRMVDQLLFLMVEWARSSPFFKEIKVEDQMKLLQHSWSEILILDFVYRQVQEFWGTELVLPNSPRLNFEVLDKLGLTDVRGRLCELIKKSRELKLDKNEYMCLKFLILLNPDVSGLENRQYVEQSQEKVNAALLEYCLSFYPEIKDKFSQILLRLPEIRLISIRMEEFLYFKHLNNQVPDQTLLTEMLHSKRK
ncbi:hypothetical protein C0Q70_18192 [Pomacea canaliculata]|uniref:Uncharacterized protein n=1 Tax=Pomacea canaliculata TaxID=400727 RepID=A0A2T7NMK2_POMCA|nr:nuclear receptor subfamily 5 group A member 2-like isoform X3 [Pomacea canaliculata]PVD22382.1 hypothetical protein C0Q70_18192 [Pomacea canaliculata]